MTTVRAEDAERAAGFIRAGLKARRVIEASTDYFTPASEKYGGHYVCCALGLMTIGFAEGDPDAGYEKFYKDRDRPVHERIADLVGIPPRLAYAIDQVHQRSISAETIANRLTPVLV